MKKELDAPRWQPPAPPEPDRRPIAEGDVVHVRGLNLRGKVVSMDEDAGDAEVSVGSVRLRLDLSRLSKSQEAAQEPSPDETGGRNPGVSFRLGPGLASGDLDVRGLRAEEARMKLEEFLDRAVRDGYSSVRVIHGRGTGALRNARAGAPERAPDGPLLRRRGAPARRHRRHHRRAGVSAAVGGCGWLWSGWSPR